MTRYQGDLAFHSITRKSANQVTEPVIPPIAAEAEVVAVIPAKEKCEENLECLDIDFHAPSLVEDQSFYVDFKDGDMRNPVNFSPARKWVMTINACAFAGIVGAAVSSYAMGYSSMIRDLDCTLFQATMGLSMYALGVGLAPLVTSSFSEEFGRLLFYIISSLMFMLTEVMIALAPNVQTVIVARFLGGAFASTGSTLVAGTIADIWLPHQRGFPMSLYSVGIVASLGLGPSIAGWIEANPSLGWRWIQWVHVIVSGVYFISVLLFMTETRSAVILTRMARKIRKDTGDGRYRARAEKNKPSLASMIRISCTRPLHLLLTEPIVQSFSLWIGFIWGVLYILIDSVSGEFQSVYGFGVGETGTVFVTITIGSLLGYLANVCQERLYHKYVHRKGPDARLYIACVASVVLPAGMLVFAWTTRPDVPWIVPLVGITFFMASAFAIYQVVFVYLADCYGPYASSALAGQSLCRNILATVFPLFATQMFDRMTYKWADTLFALIAVAMIPIPYILFFYGSRIRQRSPISRKILDIEEENKRANLEKL
ncbi:MFS general substrate transporter [Rhizopogon vinicolor AM-OR11-026]|uniref:MFS general substrate transporter n=1 Tax=Rhizopogon vinicolor AM-OR11-026 TaxID=1314800 RepID=A0A1B7MMI0_9AGAM|nr:MFS general substrate transporter [Rhizopogon vinicolor AM-OR11-026]